MQQSLTRVLEPRPNGRANHVGAGALSLRTLISPTTIVAGILLIALAAAVRPLEIVEGFTLFLDPLYSGHDAYQHVAPFLRYYAQGIFDDDVYTRYYLEVLSPGGFAVVMEFLAGHFDPRAVAKTFSLLAYAMTGICVVLVGWRLGRATTACAALLLFLGSDAIVQFLMGGLPRTFAYPALALFLVGLAYGRPSVMVIATLVGFAFYYLTGAVCLVGLTLYLALPNADRGAAQHWGFVSRAVLLLVVGVACAGVFLAAQERGDFGPLIGPDRYAEFPEAGPGGRYFPEPQNIVVGSASWTVEALTSHRPNFWSAHLVVAEYTTPIGVAVLLLIGGMAVVSLHRPTIIRCMLPFIAAAILFGLAVAVFPRLYFPVRYFEISLPLLIPICLPWAIHALAERTAWVRRDRRRIFCATFAPLVVALALVGGRSPTSGIAPPPEGGAEVYRTISQMPTDVLVAGWPEGIVDGVPYHAERRAFLGYETHQTFHADHALETRRRMLATVDAYYSTDLEPALALRDGFGVTHLIVELPYYRDAPTYFQPFDEYVAKVRAQNPGTPAILRYTGPAKIYEDGDVFILDLSRL
jgi:hypothetical protein